MLLGLYFIILFEACSGTGRIITGEDASWGEYTFFGLILPEEHVYFHRDDDQGLQVHCGGAFITHRYFLTAFHCFRNQTDVQWVIVTNIENRCDPEAHGGQFLVEELIFNPESELVGIIAADIAMARVAEDVPDIKPIDLPSSDIFIGMEAIVIGYGLTSYNRSRPIVPKDITCSIKKAFMYVPDPLQCRLPTTHHVEGSFCVKGVHEFHSTACRGDSGGPILTVDEHNNKVIIGISSFGDKFCNTDFADDYYTNVYDYIPWIMGVIREDGGKQPRFGKSLARTLDTETADNTTQSDE